jgi:hypothetical protein
MYAKRRDILMSVVAMLHCRSAQIEGLAICLYLSKATGQHCDKAAGQRAV